MSRPIDTFNLTDFERAQVEAMPPRCDLDDRGLEAVRKHVAGIALFTGVTLAADELNADGEPNIYRPGELWSPDDVRAALAGKIRLDTPAREN